MGTPETFSDPICKEFRAGFTELDLPIGEGTHLLQWWRKGLLAIPPMVLLAEDMDKPNENPDILFLLAVASE